MQRLREAAYHSMVAMQGMERKNLPERPGPTPLRSGILLRVVPVTEETGLVTRWDQSEQILADEVHSKPALSSGCRLNKWRSGELHSMVAMKTVS